MRSRENAGRLYVCPTPIGNLEDITIRVLRMLREVDLVAAEDTRVTGKLLTHFDISKPLVSYREYGEERRIEGILSELASGRSIALVSDAGTPGLSDPGHKLIKAAIENGFEIEVLPGPSAVITALVASGLPTDSFVYQGFLPRKSGERRRLLTELLESGRTVVLYEAPHRILALLKELSDIGGERRVVVARELTKRFEEVIRGSAQEIIERLGERPRGEMVVVIDRGKPRRKEVTPDELATEVERFIRAGVSKKDAISRVSKNLNQPKRAVYEAAKGIKAKL
ncbi:MAG: 16S rRNA (cytidine(1402)-2'-O)-methyltransferase [Actinobacteria bacterium]|nr:16S rRNA (cytidine(1402)-2'-O)-methyltransferase [Actinomycetota bacterium]